MDLIFFVFIKYNWSSLISAAICFSGPYTVFEQLRNVHNVYSSLFSVSTTKSTMVMNRPTISCALELSEKRIETI